MLSFTAYHKHIYAKNTDIHINRQHLTHPSEELNQPESSQSVVFKNQPGYRSITPESKHLQQGRYPPSTTTPLSKIWERGVLYHFISSMWIFFNFEYFSIEKGLLRTISNETLAPSRPISNQTPQRMPGNEDPPPDSSSLAPTRRQKKQRSKRTNKHIAVLYFLALPLRL